MAKFYTIYHPPTRKFLSVAPDYSVTYCHGISKQFQSQYVAPPKVYSSVGPAKAKLSELAKIPKIYSYMIKGNEETELLFLLDLEVVEIDVVTTYTLGKSLHRAIFQVPKR